MNKKLLKTLKSSEKGKLGEIATIQKFISRGIPVYLPTSLDDPVDILAEFDGKINRIQVKTSTQRTPTGSSVVFGINSGYRVSKNKVVPRKKSYDNIDYFSCYDLVSDRLYLISRRDELSEKPSIAINDRTSYKDGDKRHFNRASDYDFDHVLDLIDLGIDPGDIIK